MASDVKWIKICTDIFDDEKIMIIESLPEADTIIVIWFKLLCLAGKTNNGGVFMLNDTLCYTDEMFATIFRRPVNTIRLALAALQTYGLIEIINSTVTIPKWEKHQSLEKLERKREATNKRVSEWRARQASLVTRCNAPCNALQSVTDGVTDGVSDGVTHGVTNDVTNARVTLTDIDIDKEYKQQQYSGSEVRLSTLFDKYRIPMTTTYWQELSEFMESGITKDMVVYAVEQAIKYNHLNWAYISKMLNDWVCAGYADIDAVKATDAAHRANAQRTEPPKRTNSNAGYYNPLDNVPFTV